MLFGIPESYETLKKATQKSGKNMPISCVRISSDAPVPTGAIDFNDLIDPKCLYELIYL